MKGNTCELSTRDSNKRKTIAVFAFVFFWLGRMFDLCCFLFIDIHV